MSRNPEAELLSIAAAARRLGRDWKWTLEAAKSGELPGIKLRGRWYVRNLTAHLDARQVRPTVSAREEPSRADWGPGVDVEHFTR